jgi:hypothetical protein
MVDLVRMGWELRPPVLIGYICVVVMTAFAAPDRPDNRLRLALRGFILLSLVVLVVLRAPVFFLNAPLNIDEAEFLANAIKFRGDMNTWLSVDTGSAGPVDSFPLMWPFLFGADTGFFAARITATVLLGATWLLFWAALARAPNSARICSGAALILFLGGEQSPDLIHYASELLPLLLLMCATVIVLDAVEQQPSIAWISIAGLCLGLVPFAKLQASVVAVVVGVILLWQVARHAQHPYRSSLWLISCACLPAVAILLPLAVAGGLNEFWVRYILWAKNYVGGGWEKLPPLGILPPQINALTKILHEHLLAGFVAAAAISATAAIAALPMRELARDSGARRAFLKGPAAARFVIVLIILGVSIAAAITPGRPFHHYAFLFLWPLALLAGLAWSLESPRSEGAATGRRRLQNIFGALAVLLVGAFALTEGRTTYDPEVTGIEKLFSAGQLLPDPDSRRGRMLVWGWAPEMYVFSGWTPATRDILTYNEIWPKPNRDYFRGILMADLRSNPPAYVVDAVAPGNFGFTEPEKDGIHTFPELAAFVSADYVLLSPASLAGSCPRVFVRKSMAEAIEQRYAKPSRVYDSSARGGGAELASHVVDNLAFESCADAWLPPDGQLGEITVELASAQAIAAIEMLNTRGGVNDRGGAEGTRASKTIRVTAYQGDEMVMDKEARMLRFPYATDVTVPESVGPIDRLVMRVESYAGVGGGLNEIRLRKR